MVGKLAIRDVTWADLEEISKLDLMEDDLMVVNGMGDTDIPIVLTTSCINSFNRVCRCFFEVSSGKIIGVYGVTKYDTIWFLSDKLLKKHWKEFVRGTKEEFKKLTEGVDFAFNYVHWNHKRALRWLRWLGFRRTINFYTFPPKTEKYIKIEFYKE